MLPVMRSPLPRYGVPILAVALGLLFELLLWPLIGPSIFPLFFTAAVVSAWYGGLGPGLLAGFLAALAIDYFFIPPVYSLLTDLNDLVRLGVFVVLALPISLLVIARRRTEAELRARTSQQAAVAELSQRALVGTDLATLMQEAADLVAQTLGVEYCKILELMPDGSRLLLRAGVGWKEGSVGQATVSAGTESQAGYTLLSDAPVIVADLRTETRFSGPPLLHDHGVVSGMSVIIQDRAKPFGVLGAHTTRRRRFTKDDINFLQAVANLLATVIERQRAEEQIAFQASLLDQVRHAVVATDLAGQITFWNKFAEQLYRWKAEEVMGKKILEVVIPREGQELAEEILATLPELGYWEGEFVARRKDESTFPVHAVRTVYRDAEGQAKGFIGVSLDITERKCAEDDLRKQKEILQKIFDQIPVMITFIGEDGRLKLINRAWERTLGWSLEEIQQQNLDILVECYPDPQYHQYVLNFIAASSAKWADFKTRTKDGRVIDTSWANVRLSDGTSIGIGQDITERKRAEEEIKYRHQQLVTLNAITAAISSSIELPEVLATLKKLLAEHLGVSGGLVFFYDQADDRFYLETGWGLPEGLLAEIKTFPATAFHNERVIREKEIVLRPDFLEVTPFLALGLEVAWAAWESYLCIPLLAQGEIQGVIDLFSQGPAVFSEDQIAFFKAIGQAVGVAVQNARLFDQVRAGREQLQALSRRLVEVQETERRHLARELHDEIGQVLTGLQLMLGMITRLPAEAVKANLDEAQSLVGELLARVRNLSLDLRPAMLDDLGLLPALLWQVERYTAQTEVRVNFKHTGLEGRSFAPEIETAVYRLVQEALTNVARHAGVKEVAVYVWADPASLSLQIEDQGRGFDSEAAMKAAATGGLAGMRERAILLGGQLRVESTPGAGTCLTAELPLGG